MAHEIRNVLIGSGISLFAALGSAWFAGNNQLRAQRQQFLMEQRATALREFSSVLGNGEEVLYKYEVLEHELNVAIEQPTPARMRQILESGHADQRDFIHFTSLLRSDETLLESTFNISFPTTEITVREVPDIGGSDLRQQFRI
jgi:hypothetical protein